MITEEVYGYPLSEKSTFNLALRFLSPATLLLFSNYFWKTQSKENYKRALWVGWAKAVGQKQINASKSSEYDYGQTTIQCIW